MYYLEVKPGVYLSDDKKTHYTLDKCQYCGGETLLSHHKYTSMCVDCGNTYNMYAVRRNRRLNGTLTLKTAQSHMRLLEGLLEKRQMGFKVPDTFDEELTATRELVESMEARLYSEQRPVKVACSYCGGEAHVSRDHRGIARCEACQKTYNRYRALCRDVGSLDERGCDELTAIIRAYISSTHSSPRVASVIPRLQRRIAELGGNRQIFYYTEDID